MDLHNSEHVKKIANYGYELTNFEVIYGDINYLEFTCQKEYGKAVLVIDDHTDDEEIRDFIVCSFYKDKNGNKTYYGIESDLFKIVYDLIRDIKLNIIQ